MSRNGSTNALAEPSNLTVAIFLQFENELYVIVFVSRGDVKMEVKDRLSCDLPVVGEEVEAFELQRVDKRASVDELEKEKRRGSILTRKKLIKKSSESQRTAGEPIKNEYQ